MRFAFHGVDEAGFQQWVDRTRAQGQMLNREAYLKLAQPSERNPVQHFSDVAREERRLRAGLSAPAPSCGPRRPRQ